MPRKNYTPEVRKRIARQRELLAAQLEALARELKAAKHRIRKH